MWCGADNLTVAASRAGDAVAQVGSFVVSGDQASYMTCGRGIHNSITHRCLPATTGAATNQLNYFQWFISSSKP